jgi:hypothetical protein
MSAIACFRQLMSSLLELVAAVEDIHWKQKIAIL